MTRARDVVRAAGLAGLAAGMLACGGPAAEGAAEPPIEQVPATVDGVTLRLPLDAYIAGDDEGRQLAQAHRMLAGECLRRFGLALPEEHGPGTAFEFGNSRRYGITDPALAAVYGYAPGLEPDPGEPPREALPDELTLDVLTGRGVPELNGQAIPEGGCLAEAQRRLGGDAAPPVDPMLPQQLAIESWQRSAQDSRVRTAVAGWSECMRESGLEYADPLEPPADPRFRGGPSPDELSTAAADLDCKSRSALVAVWSTVESAYQLEAIGQHADVLAQLRNWETFRLRTAQALLTEAPPG